MGECFRIWCSRVQVSLLLFVEGFGVAVGALITKMGFWGVPYYSYSIIYPRTLF